MKIMLYESLTDRLKNQHETIEELICNVDTIRLNISPELNKWSIKDNIAHLAKYQPVFIERINRILKYDNPVFERYTADTDPDFEDWRNWEISKLIDVLKTDRTNLYNLITNLKEDDLSRIGIHTKFGKLNIVQWTEFFLLHEAHHLFTIFKISNDVELSKISN